MAAHSNRGRRQAQRMSETATEDAPLGKSAGTRRWWLRATGLPGRAWLGQGESCEHRSRQLTQVGPHAPVRNPDQSEVGHKEPPCENVATHGNGHTAAQARVMLRIALPSVTTARVAILPAAQHSSYLSARCCLWYPQSPRGDPPAPHLCPAANPCAAAKRTKVFVELIAASRWRGEGTGMPGCNPQPRYVSVRRGGAEDGGGGGACSGGGGGGGGEREVERVAPQSTQGTHASFKSKRHSRSRHKQLVRD